MSAYLSDSERQMLMRIGMGEDIPFLGRNIQRRVEHRSQNWTTYSANSVPHSPSGRPINIALVGLGGAGKSELANTLVGREEFATGKSAMSVTETTRAGSFYVESQEFVVLDTPGYMVQNMESFSSAELVRRSQQILPGFAKFERDGVDALIFVINATDARGRAKEIEIMRKSRMLVEGGSTIKHCLVVATHAGSGYAADTVSSFIRYSSEAAEFRSFMGQINNRVVMVEQKASDLQVAGINIPQREKQSIRDAVLSMVGKVMQDNSFVKLTVAAIGAAVMCFPPKAIITTTSGVKTMAELQINDKVLVANPQGQKAYERVIMFSHAARESEGCFMSISTDDGKVLSLSPGHLVHVGEVGQLKTAKDVKVGDVMFAIDVAEEKAMSVKPVKVTEISKEWFTPGIYCPHTPGGSIIVDGLLASCYTDLMSPTLAHTLMYPVRMLHWVLPEDWFVWLMPYNSEQGMPKVVWKLRKMIQFMTK